ncbi:MAG: transporter [Opitutaceae bacterium]|nr:transporter [Opitutaceae bacterium]
MEGVDKANQECSYSYILSKTLHFALCFSIVVAASAAPESNPGNKGGYTLINPTPKQLMRKLSTDRPDQTESAYTVDAGHFQIELDFLKYTFDRDKSGGGNVRISELAVAPFNLKVGLLNQVDLQFIFDPYLKSRVEDRVANRSSKASGFGDLTTRLKFNFWGNDGGPTAFAMMPFVKWPLTASDIRNGETEGGVIFVLGYELPSGWSSAVMTEVDLVSDGLGGYDTEWVNSITFGHDLTDKMSGYIELFTILGGAPGAKWQGQFDLGITYALSDSIQFDLGCNIGVTKSAPDFQPFVGFSRRF